MDDIEKRMEEIRATAESIDSGGISEGVEPQAWIYRKDVTWLLTQLTASRQECERLRDVRDRVLLNLNCIYYGSANPDFFLEDSIQRLKATIPDVPPSDPAATE